MTYPVSSRNTLALSLMLSAPLLSGCGNSCPPVEKPLPPPPPEIRIVQTIEPCMADPTLSKIPDPDQWTFDKPTGWAHLPPSEVLRVRYLLDFITQNLAACHAVKASH